MTGTIEKIPRIINLLKNRNNISPTTIAKTIGSDKRTVDKVLCSMTKMNVVSCKSIRIESRKISSCSLTPQFKRFLNSHKEMK